MKFESGASLNRYDALKMRKESGSNIRDQLHKSLMGPTKPRDRGPASAEDRPASPSSPLSRSSALRGSHRASSPVLGSFRGPRKSRRRTDFDLEVDGERLDVES